MVLEALSAEDSPDIHKGDKTYMQVQVRLCGETLVTFPLLEVFTGSSEAGEVL